MINLLLLLIFTILLVVVWINSYLKSCHRYWQDRRFPGLSPKFLFGNAGDLCLGRKSMLDYLNHLYEKLKSTKVLGIYMFYKPNLYTNDIQLINCILSKDFRYFVDRGIKFDTVNEPLTRHLFHLEGQQWKSMRHKVMPSLMTEGIKMFLPMLINSAIKLGNHLDQILTTEKDLNLKDILSRYAADVIGICAYGTESGALTRDDTQFYKMSKKIFAPRVKTIIKLIFPNLPNSIAEFLDIKMVETQVSEYFRGIIKEQLKLRRQSGQEQPKDFLAFMMKLQKDGGDLDDDLFVTDDLIMAQCFMFFIAGYENTTGIISAALFELADHPEIQDKLFDEVNKFCSKDGILKITYEQISEMTYLDMVVCEILRIYPPATALIRECAQDYNIAGTNLVIEKGVQVVIPVCGLHRDPQYFPYPNQFNPDANFSKEVRASRHRCAYMPFGDGPRYCIGKKFGITQIKVALIVLMNKYKFYPSLKMKRPVTFEKKTFITSIEGGAWVRAESRSPFQSYIIKEKNSEIL